MRNIRAVAGRELGAYFLSPIAYAVAASFLFTTGLAFGLGTFTPGGESSLQSLCSPWIVIILVFIVPMLTMRLMSEELRGGTIETLMTAPVTDTEVVLGKFLGALVLYLVLLATLLLYPILLAMYGDVDGKLLTCNYLGMILLGCVYIAVGLFFSTWSKHDVISALLSLTVLALMTFASDGLARLLEGWPRALLQQVSLRTHFQDFARGLVTLNHLVFFVTITGLFLFLTVKLLETRRWQ